MEYASQWTSCTRWCIPLLFVVLTISGCGESNNATVTGLVTLDGKPLNGGNVLFAAEEGGRPAAVSAIDEKGRYELKTSAGPGLIAGNYKVMVMRDEKKPESMAIPQKYTSSGTTPLKLTVKTGENDCPLELKR